MEAFLTIADAAKLIAAKQLSPVELTRICLDRIRNSIPHCIVSCWSPKTAPWPMPGRRGSDNVGKDKRAARRNPYRTQGHLQHSRYSNHRPFEVVGA